MVYEGSYVMFEEHSRQLFQEIAHVCELRHRWDDLSLPRLLRNSARTPRPYTYNFHPLSYTSTPESQNQGRQSAPLSPEVGMSSGFVSGGTTDQPIERDDEWRKAQEAIEATRKRKEEEGQLANGKSLYEVLQQNNGD